LGEAFCHPHPIFQPAELSGVRNFTDEGLLEALSFPMTPFASWKSNSREGSSSSFPSAVFRRSLLKSRRASRSICNMFALIISCPFIVTVDMGAIIVSSLRSEIASMSGTGDVTSATEASVFTFNGG
jgi:hypothetical protein